MSVVKKSLLVTLLVAVPAFALSPVLFSASPDFGEPSQGQVPFFLVLSVLDSLLLGAGVAFVAFAWPTVRRAGGRSRARAIAIYVTLAWLMLSWYPHGGLHVSNGTDLFGLLLIDYGFHVPLIVAPVVLTWAFLGWVRDRSNGSAARIDREAVQSR